MHGHARLHAWPHKATCMVTQGYTHGNTRLHAWSHKATCMVTQGYMHGHARLHAWSCKAYYVYFMWSRQNNQHDDAQGKFYPKLKTAYTYSAIAEQSCNVIVNYHVGS